MKIFLLVILLVQVAINGYSDVPRLVKFEANLFLSNDKKVTGCFYTSSEDVYSLYSEGIKPDQRYTNEEMLVIFRNAYLYNDTLMFFTKVYSIESIGEAALSKDILYIPRKTILNVELIKVHFCIDESIEGSVSHADCYDSFPMTQFNATEISL